MQNHALILCVSEGFLSNLICIHTVGMGTSGLHGLTLCVSEGFLVPSLCIHIVGMGTSDIHALILCDSEGHLNRLQAKSLFLALALQS